MNTAVHNHVTVIGLASVLFLPLIASVVAVHFNAHILIIPICFIKALTFGICLSGISVAFGGSGWLMRILMLFSDSCMIVLLLWFWCRHLTGKGNMLMWDAAVCAGAAFVIGLFDYFLVSPFLMELLS